VSDDPCPVGSEISRDSEAARHDLQGTWQRAQLRGPARLIQRLASGMVAASGPPSMSGGDLLPCRFLADVWSRTKRRRRRDARCSGAAQSRRRKPNLVPGHLQSSPDGPKKHAFVVAIDLLGFGPLTVSEEHVPPGLTHRG